MKSNGVIFREATIADIPSLFDLRSSVKENLLTVDQLAQLGITHATVAASFDNDCKGWVAERHEQIIGFSIADRSSQTIFALFIRPGSEGGGLGRELLRSAVNWLWDNGAKCVWLTTAHGTRADGFYRHLGWTLVKTEPSGELRFELHRAITVVRSERGIH